MLPKSEITMLRFLEQHNRVRGEEIRSITDVNHINGGLIRFRTKNYNVCGNKALARISGSIRNPEKLYFSCDGE